MRSRFIRVTGSLLGLLAILLMALVPAFSHALAATEDAHDEHEQGITHCSMPSMQHQQAPHDSHDTHIHLDACGYCSLLAHMPAIVAFPPAVAPVRPPAVRPVATRADSVRAAEPMPGGQARAPPPLFS
jgi:hypothetical protein